MHGSLRSQSLAAESELKGLRTSGATKERDKEAYSLRLRFLIRNVSTNAEKLWYTALSMEAVPHPDNGNEPSREQFAARAISHPASCWTNVVNLSTRGIPMGFDFNVSREFCQFVYPSAWLEN
ncbi:hypothetical protein TrVFT333_000529 [Trichoderma virens FT-333]|nr:hypothetical protein TrVFT333_000529 [Trichoderma virens FT-333]